MEGKLLVSPAGFETWKVVETAKAVRPSRVILVHTDHPSALENIKRSRRALESVDIGVEDWQVKDAFDFVEWYETIDRAAEQSSDAEVVINLTPGHGVAISMAAMVAAARRLPCVCFDKYGPGLHHVSPSIIFHKGALEGTDKRLLRVLAQGRLPVTEAARRAEITEVSTASVALKRLHERGFVDRQQEGRTVYYSLRQGVRQFLGSIIGR
jgi:DNA-binding transcriptional ArsR family regulator